MVGCREREIWEVRWRMGEMVFFGGGGGGGWMRASTVNSTCLDSSGYGKAKCVRLIKKRKVGRNCTIRVCYYSEGTSSCSVWCRLGRPRLLDKVPQYVISRTFVSVTLRLTRFMIDSSQRIHENKVTLNY